MDFSVGPTSQVRSKVERGAGMEGLSVGRVHQLVAPGQGASPWEPHHAKAPLYGSCATSERGFVGGLHGKGCAVGGGEPLGTVKDVARHRMWKGGRNSVCTREGN